MSILRRKVSGWWLVPAAISGISSGYEANKYRTHAPSPTIELTICAYVYGAIMIYPNIVTGGIACVVKAANDSHE